MTSHANTNSREAYELLARRSREGARIQSLEALADWDMDLAMPEADGAFRGEVKGWLADTAYRLWADDVVGRALDEATSGAAEWSPEERANLAWWRRKYDQLTKLPADFKVREAEAQTRATEAWKKAKEENAFAPFQEPLTALVDLAREKSRCFGGGAHPYDALLDEFMPGTSVASCDAIFGAVRTPLGGLLDEVLALQDPLPDPTLQELLFPEEAQKTFAREVVAALGFDFSRGIFAPTPHHPFTTTLGPHDVRLTTRYQPTALSGILGAIHEAGHGLYEQGLPPERFGEPAGTALDPSVHEAQSRFWENHVGRSAAFWTFWLPRLRELCGIGAQQLPLDRFLRWLNRVERCPRRLDADEGTYVLHILVRYELERDLLAGRLEVADLPDAWAAAYRTTVGVEPRDLREGVLQDIHWAIGAFGYFPGYALGSFNAAQLDAALHREVPDVDARMQSGDFSAPLTWMREHVHRYGEVLTAPDLIRQATGQSTGPEDFLTHLKSSYQELFPRR